MNKLFYKSMFHSLDDEEIKNVEICYDELKKIIGNNFQEIVNNDAIKIKKEYKNQFDRFLYELLLIYPKINMDMFKTEIELLEDMSEGMFWNIVLDYCDQCNHVKEKTKFIQELDQTEYERIIEYVFERYVRHHNYIVSYDEYDEEKIKVLIKYVNTILSCVIEDFFDLDRIVEEYAAKFGLDTCKLEYAYNLVNSNKIELMLKNIICNFQEIKIDD